MYELLTFSYIIYVTSVIHTFVTFSPELYSTTYRSGVHVPAEEEILFVQHINWI